jgi:hypothetical protein
MGSSSARRVRVERGIYRQRNGKYAVCWRPAGRLRFRTVGFDLAEARRERLALIATTREGKVPVSPRLRLRPSPVGGWTASKRRSPPASATRARSRRTATSSTATSYQPSRDGASPRSRSTTSLGRPGCPPAWCGATALSLPPCVRPHSLRNRRPSHNRGRARRARRSRPGTPPTGQVPPVPPARP